MLRNQLDLHIAGLRNGHGEIERARLAAIAALLDRDVCEYEERPDAGRPDPLAGHALDVVDHPRGLNDFAVHER
jgi:hypothetical protein